MQDTKLEPEIANILCQIQGQAVRPQLKPKLQPKDHTRENILRLRQYKREESVKPLKADWKNDKYSHVQSKVTAFIQKSPPAPRPQSANFLRAHSRTGRINSAPTISSSADNSNQENVDPYQTAIRNKKEAVLPRPASVSRLQLEDDDVAATTGSKKNSSLRRSPSASTLDSKMSAVQTSHQLGALPKYLKERQKQLKEEEKRRQEVATVAVPAGHVLMSDEDRMETLRVLKQNEQELIQKLASLPVRVDTLRIRQQKEALEEKLAKVEEGIRVFSRSKVYVQNNA